MKNNYEPMPNPDNNPNRTDDDELREDVRYSYHLMERYKDKADRGADAVTWQEKVKREREGEMALRE